MNNLSNFLLWLSLLISWLFFILHYLQLKQDQIKKIESKKQNQKLNRLYQFANSPEIIRQLEFQKFVLDQSAIVAITDEKGIITYVNDKFCQISQYSRDELIGKTHKIIKSDYHSAEFFKELWITISQGKIWQGEVKNKAKDGSCYWVATTIVPFLNEMGKPFQYMAIRFDITQLKNTQKALEKAKLNLEKANQIKSEFLATISHEIRTPMNGIIGMTTLLLDTRLNEQQLFFTDTIRQCNDQLLNIINEILDFSKIESGKIQLEENTFNLQESIKTIFQIINNKAQAKNLKLNYLITPQTPNFIQADNTRLNQILIHLLNNAIKFTEKGEINLLVDSELEDDNIYRLNFAVKDTGIGISEDYKEKLFKPFSQGDSSTTRKYAGTGLGLVICQRLCDLMGGEIWLESQENVGSTFYFTILAIAVKINQEISEKFNNNICIIPEQLEQKSLRILLAEDNNTNQKIALLILKRLGYTADVVSNGLEVLEAFSRQFYDVILMDLMMPEMDGIEATRQLFHLWSYPKRPRIIAMTANHTPSDRRRCLEAGMDDYISKPIHLQSLKFALEKCQRIEDN